VTYRDLVKVVPRFTRAVNVERDACIPAAVDGYIITSTAHAVIARLARALAEPVGHRAWTLTGPYGSGKSAFAVYLANLFGPRSSSGQLARKILSAHSKTLSRDLFDLRKSTSMPPDGFCSVVVTGASEPLLPALLRASIRDVHRYCSRGRKPRALHQLEQLEKRRAAGEKISPTAFVDVLADVAKTLQRSGRSQGILLIIDELGKFLEFAARDPETDHIYLLQQLAEATARLENPGLFAVTILHQSFETYASGLRPAVRDEWAKVQGRFEDIAFQEPPEEFVALLSNAIEQRPHPVVRVLRSRAKAHAEVAYKLGLAPRGLGRAQFVQMLQRCAPLHPLTVLVLARMCRKFGQNQRSLFSFLNSQDPHGFAAFLAQPADQDRTPFYCLDALYNFVSDTFGAGLTVGEASTRWAEIQSTLDRCLAAPEEELRLIKAVGVLSAIGTYGNLKPSPAILELAFASSRAKAVIERLGKRSILVYRKHSDSYALWEGSDIDLDARLREARVHVSPGTNLARRLNELHRPRPLVAKRHSAQTGTLRYFQVRFADVNELARVSSEDSDADGLLIYVLPSSLAEADRAIELATNSELREHRGLLIAVPKEVDALADAASEIELLRWVEQHTPELQSDVVARRELRARIAVAEEHLEREVRALFSPSESTAHSTLWLHDGIPQHVETARSLSQVLSDICDALYSHTPRLHNELINRRVLSSAAAGARRNLVEAMITRSTEERLGIQGAPPELSMYVSVLGATGIHRHEETGYAFGSPTSDQGLNEVWAAIERFFAGCELERRSVAQLFTELQRPPFGLKMGLIPVLFCAAALAHDTEVALYEGGAFIPELSTEVFERLLHSPDKFELRRYRVAGIRREVFNQFATLLDTVPKGKSENLIVVVRPLFRFFNRLPAYTKQTKTLSPVTLAVRDALFAAREPDTLLFDDLPRACGVSPFLPTSAATNSEVPEFFKQLRKALSELQRAYDDLLSELQQVLLRAFNASGARGREVVRFRARTMSDHALEPRLRAFIQHLVNEDVEDVPWIESIASLLAGKPARSWTDAERARYELNLSELARSFRHLEALALELNRRATAGKAPGDVLRIGVTDRFSKDLEAVVVVEPEQRSAVTEAVLQIEACLDGLAAGSVPALALAALATTSRKFLSELHDAGGSKIAKMQEVSHE
jgi:hypothetical protein